LLGLRAYKPEANDWFSSLTYREGGKGLRLLPEPQGRSRFGRRGLRCVSRGKKGKGSLDPESGGEKTPSGSDFTVTSQVLREALGWAKKEPRIKPAFHSCSGNSFVRGRAKRGPHGRRDASREQGVLTVESHHSSTGWGRDQCPNARTGPLGCAKTMILFNSGQKGRRKDTGRGKGRIYVSSKTNLSQADFAGDQEFHVTG